MTSPQSYAVPAGASRAEVRDRGSRFLAILEPIGQEADAAVVLGRLADEFPAATHLCWALRTGTPARERSSDAGEPAGTAGAPILQALRAARLGDAMLVVARWFGGTKLGRGGLVRAYAAAARAVLEEAPRREHVPTVELRIRVAHTRAGAVKRLLRPPAIELIAETYAVSVNFALRVQVQHQAALLAALADLGAVLEKSG